MSKVYIDHNEDINYCPYHGYELDENGKCYQCEIDTSRDLQELDDRTLPDN